MLKTYLALVALFVAGCFGLRAQVVTTEPSPLQEDSKDVVIYFHADRGNKGLMGQAASAQIYAHTGVCVEDASGNATDWKYAPTWGANLPKYKLEYVSPDLWKLNIGDIRTYYGVAANETVKKLAFVFRNSNNSKEGKGDGGKDIFVDVLDTGFQLALTSSSESQFVNASTGAVTFTAGTTIPADITIAVNGKSIAQSKGVTSLKGDYTFTATGDYEVTATAVAGGATQTQSLSFCNPAASQPGSGAVPAMGATRNADGSMTFCVAAPGKTTALIVGNWNNYKVTSTQTMKYVDGPAAGEGSFRYFTITIPNLPKDQPIIYYYNIDGKSVGDPYARLVLVNSEDKWISPTVYPGLPEYPVEVNEEIPLAYYKDNLGDYKWKVTDFKGASKDDLVIYELLLRDFTGTEGKADGNGTVRGAMSKIPYLKGLGVNAVELLPIQEFNGNISWGYNPNFYFAIDKAYGTPEDYKAFIDECHANGIAVILDVVFNQSDWLHPWYQLYSVGQNPFYNATAPHAYSVLNDWNQGYPLVRQQWYDMVKYWLKEYKVDGYRFDLVKGLGNNDSYPNSGDSGTNAFNQSRVDNMKAIHDAMREVNPDAYFINENLAGAQEENEMAKDGELNWMNCNYAGCEFAMGWSGASLNSMWAPKADRTPGSLVSYLESHDEERLAYKQKMYGNGAVKTDADVACRRLAGAAAQMLLVPGSHMIWEFSEMGNAQTTKDANGGNNTDPKIVDWALMDKPANAALVQSYRELIGIRLNNPDMFAQTANYSLNFSNWGARTVTSLTSDKELYAIINCSVTAPVEATVMFRSNDSGAYRILSQSEGPESTFNASTKKVTVPANGYVVIATNNVSGMESIEFDDAQRMTVTVDGDVVTVTGAPAGIEIYSLAGARVASTPATSMTRTLANGIYVVRSGSEAVKVAVF
ncbi:MAG: hypothetical protein HDS79_02240 [Bacteroidales bacterium]|nr:hypothetical protein [Bacteroidales bacterium]